jgi:predicted transcriptional regulator of viral defense system
MKYLEFKNAVKEFPIISLTHISNINKKPQTLKVQLSGWQKKGLVIKLKRGLYILNESDRKIEPSRIFLANALYSPSYVSTTYAFGYYDLIPEKVEDVTSITTKKTAKFTNTFGTFIYQHLKTNLFFGLKEIKDENGFPVLIAEPEKAMLDFIYLNLQDFKGEKKDVFSLSYRFQNLNILKKKKLTDFAKKYENKEIFDVVENLLSLMKEGR